MATKKKPTHIGQWPLTPDGDLLVLRTCAADMTSSHGFTWPESGEAVAADWDPNPTRDCGGGLHGLPWGQGAVDLLDWSDDSRRWLVVAVDPADVANLDQRDKIRYRRGEVVHVGTRDDAIAYMNENGGAHLTLPFGTATAGYRGTATAGVGGTATAGVGGTATAGDFGTATAGDFGTATAGDRGTATAGVGGTATAGDFGTATAGYRGIIQVRWFDGRRYRLTIGYVGEDGIEPDVPYRCDDNGKLVRA